MQLISTLASGVKGAENGTAQIYVRGTSTRATYYTDFEAGTSIATGADVFLDSNGGAEIYVNQYVDVVVKNSDGSTVREFTEGKAAPNLEYIGQSFTGVDYTTGASATRKPVNLQTILDAWLTSAGAADFEVDLVGTDTPLSIALGNLGGYFFNVKSPTYAAVGDGIMDDTTAINAAIVAADEAGGGVVFFPKGTYRITSALSLPGSVSLLGVGPYSSVITIDHATANAINPAGTAGTGFQFIRSIGITAAQANTGIGINAEDTQLILEDCYFGGANLYKLVSCAYNGSYIAIKNCVFEPGATAASANCVVLSSQTAAGTTWGEVTGCVFRFSAAQTSDLPCMLRIGVGSVTGCTFDASAVTAAITARFISAGSVAGFGQAVRGCQFVGSTTATTNAFWFPNDSELYENGNYLDGNMSYMYEVIAPFNGADATSSFTGSREGRKTTVTDNGAAVSLESDQYGFIQLIRTAAAAQIIYAPVITEGSYFTLFINNNQGVGSGNFTLSSTYFRQSTGVFAVAANNCRVLHFRAIAISTTIKWNLISDSGDMAV